MAVYICPIVLNGFAFEAAAGIVNIKYILPIAVGT